MRVETAVPVWREGFRFVWRRRVFGFMAILMTSALLSCSEELEVTAPGATIPALGWLTGSVTLLGNDGPANPPGSVTLYATPEDLALRVSRYGATLNRRSGEVRTYDFIVANVQPGSYYVLFCWTIGCGEYRDPGTGELRTIRIRAGRTTRLSFGL